MHHLSKGLRCLLNRWNYKISNRTRITKKTMINDLVTDLIQSPATNEVNSSTYNGSNQTHDTSTKQHDNNHHNFSLAKTTASINIDPYSDYQLTDRIRHSEASTSDSEDELDHLYIDSTPTSPPQVISAILPQPEASSPFAVERSSYTAYSKKSNEIFSIQKLPSTQISTEECDEAEYSQINNATIKRKRTKYQTSNTDAKIATKQPTRLTRKKSRVI
ncbi:unnamed protein product [Rotaria socialis]|uniref:Uncharacterized protein n=4 Tax=Rotaria socialis TaxID=392032 RepID=A0A821WLK5_9BILA|nr:unnamed protein product [Rotaria socialis]CAF4929450.1 unnamed protein product [Rotaria socialis]